MANVSYMTLLSKKRIFDSFVKKKRRKKIIEHKRYLNYLPCDVL